MCGCSTFLSRHLSGTKREDPEGKRESPNRKSKALPGAPAAAGSGVAFGAGFGFGFARASPTVPLASLRLLSSELPSGVNVLNSFSNHPPEMRNSKVNQEKIHLKLFSNNNCPIWDMWFASQVENDIEPRYLVDTHAGLKDQPRAEE